MATTRLERPETASLPPPAPLCTWSGRIDLRTPGPMSFVDLTERLARCVHRAGLEHGLLSVQCLHTSAALLVNEDEPLLLDDFRSLLDRWAPRERRWQHDRFDVRTVNLGPGERPNGHAHARALVLRSTETLHVSGGHLRLGRWQRVFLVECDDARDRTVSVLALGAPRQGSPCA